MQLFINNWSAVLTAPAAASAVSLSVPLADAAKLTGLGGGDHYLLTLAELDGSGVETAWEIVKVTGSASGVLTVLRGQEGTGARDWAAAAVISARVTKGGLEALRAGTGTAVGDDVPQALGVASPGSSAAASRQDHVHAKPTAADIGAATTAQGAKADTAVQPAALASGLAGKVDKDGTKVLTDQNYTSAEKAKLAGLEGAHFKGLHASLASLQAAHPSAVAGDYADVDSGVGADVARYIWDVSDSTWLIQSGASGSMTAAQIKTAYESNPDTNAFSDAEQAKLGGIASGATANAADAALRDRSTHTGSQAASTISDFAATVRSTVLTGLSLANASAGAATDSLLVFLGKLQAQITGLVTTVGGKQDALVSGSTLKTVNGNSLLGAGNIAISGGSSAVALSDYAGADPTGAANSHAQVATAIATGAEEIYLQPGALYRDDAYTNPMGAEFAGGGKIVKNIPGGQQQLNTNADKNQRVSGQEYAFAFHNFLMTQYGSPTRALSVRFSGDSTTTGDGIGASSYFINNLFKEMMYQEGLNPMYGITSTNAGQSGKNTEDWNTTYAAADAAAAPDLLVLRWGVNDGSRGAAAFITSLRAGLAKVRASRSLSQTTILLMAPNSTSDTVHMRDEKYYEAIIPGIKQAARDYQCVFADTYSYLKDARPAANVWMDDPYADGSAIHPKGIMNVWITQLIASAVLAPSLKMAAGRCEFRSIGGLDSVASAGTVPAGYLYGHHIQRATPPNGFPVDGTVLTWRSQDGLVMQINYPYKTVDQATHWVRYGSSSAGAGIIAGWSSWVDMGAVAAPAAVYEAVVTVTETAKTAVLTDAGSYQNFNNTAAKAYTIPPQSSVAWVADTTITVANDNTSNLTLVAGSGVTLKAPSGGSLVVGPDMVVTLKRTAADIWRVIGQTV